MASRILNWHFSGNPDMPAYFADKDYNPTKIRLYATNAAVIGGGCTVDIRDDGVSILSDYANLPAGDNLEEDAESFLVENPLIEEGSVITCHMMNTGGASNISIQFELDSLDTDE